MLLFCGKLGNIANVGLIFIFGFLILEKQETTSIFIAFGFLNLTLSLKCIVLETALRICIDYIFFLFKYIILLFLSSFEMSNCAVMSTSFFFGYDNDDDDDDDDTLGYYSAF